MESGDFRMRRQHLRIVRHQDAGDPQQHGSGTRSDIGSGSGSYHDAGRRSRSSTGRRSCRDSSSRKIKEATRQQHPSRRLPSGQAPISYLFSQQWLVGYGDLLDFVKECKNGGEGATSGASALLI